MVEGSALLKSIARALIALDELEEAPPLRPWMFWIAHNGTLKGEKRQPTPIAAASASTPLN